jgi:hypothetical protein
LKCVSRQSHPHGHNKSVTDPSPPSSRQAPKRPPAATKDLMLLVRVPGRPEDVQAFTAAERRAAEVYAAATGGIVDELPA